MINMRFNLQIYDKTAYFYSIYNKLFELNSK